MKNMKKNRTIKFFGYFLTLSAGIYFLYYFYVNFPTVPDLKFSALNVLILSLICLFYASGILIASFAWVQLLSSHKIVVSKPQIISAYCQAQFAKYLPGNIGHHIGRVFLAKKIGIPVHVSLQTMLIETSWFITIGCVLALVTLISFPSTDVLITGIPIKPTHFIGTLVLVFFTLPFIVIKFTNQYCSSFIERLTGVRHIITPNFWITVRVLSIILLNFLLVGQILNYLAINIFLAKESQFVSLVGVYALSWIVGFIIPGAPAGIGVREALMVTLLEPIYGSGVAAGLSLIFRFISTLGDFLAFLLSFPLKGYPNQKD